jgi:LacI family transcriptional regulator
MMVGVLVQDIVSPFFSHLVLGVEQALEASAYRPMLTTTHWGTGDVADEVRALQQLLERRVDGVIVLGGRLPDETLREMAAQVPMVIVARQVPGLEDRCVYVDSQLGAFRATRYLIGLGHRRIAHVAGMVGHPDAIDRLAGYRRALEESGIRYDEDLVATGLFTSEGGITAVEELVARGQQFTAVFVANDQAAYGVMLGLYNHGYRLPADISMVGFDDLSHSAFCLPPLTTIRQPTNEMGRAAAAGVLRLLDGADAALPTFSPELVIRSSAVRVPREP